MVFRKKQQVIIICLVVVMVFGFVLFRYLPLRKRIQAVEQEISMQRSIVTTVLQQGQKVPALKQQLLELQSLIGNYEQQVPSDRELGGFLHEIADLMNKHNLKEHQVQPNEEIQFDGLNCIPVSMQCKGTLAQVFEFYRQLQNLDRLVRIEQVKLVSDRNFDGLITMQTEASIYYRPTDSEG